MTKAQIIEALKDFKDDECITLGGDGDELRHAYELKPTRVCGKGQWMMSYFCVCEPGHEGPCYCSCKSVEFDPD